MSWHSGKKRCLHELYRLQERNDTMRVRRNAVIRALISCATMRELANLYVPRVTNAGR